MTKENEVPVELTTVNSDGSQKPKMVSRAESTSLMLRSHGSTETDGARRSTGQQTQSYDIHKGIAESAMDISLLTANANQLRLLITYNNRSRTYTACITLVIISLVLQILVASGVIIIKAQPKSKLSPSIEKLKIATSIGLTFVTVINILVASLVVTEGPGGSGGNGGSG
ncbi:ninjurin-B-like [Sabethes cyaneus]|uniref:ninjurin-B-like n=1 Tax=Sabethes cyaneus TaxID=53552 RepID=UPI00237ED3FD|nr:ninjurin-B-like [Sabethes cyaneus]